MMKRGFDEYGKEAGKHLRDKPEDLPIQPSHQNDKNSLGKGQKSQGKHETKPTKNLCNKAIKIIKREKIKGKN